MGLWVPLQILCLLNDLIENQKCSLMANQGNFKQQGAHRGDCEPPGPCSGQCNPPGTIKSPRLAAVPQLLQQHQGSPPPSCPTPTSTYQVQIELWGPLHIALYCMEEFLLTTPCVTVAWLTRKHAACDALCSVSKNCQQMVNIQWGVVFFPPCRSGHISHTIFPPLISQLSHLGLLVWESTRQKQSLIDLVTDKYELDITEPCSYHRFPSNLEWAEP